MANRNLRDSAHADQTKLMKWCMSGRKSPKKIYLNHGEPHASEELAGKIQAEYGVDVAVPANGDTYAHP